MRNNIIAIMYDFDKTLCTRDMQEYTFLPNLGIEASDFWNDANKLRENNKMDQVLSYMYLMFRKTVDNNRSLKRSYLNEMGKTVELFPGVVDWFERINEYGRSLGFEVEHYIISSGLKEIIEGSEIGDKFKSIFASEFFYNEDGNAMWPKLAVNYTNKTQFLIRINKGILDISDDNSLNAKMLEDDRRISSRNMIYIGDGFTDIPSMKMVRENGGFSIAVYQENKKDTVRKLLEEDRVDYTALADYSENSKMDKLVKEMLMHMKIYTSLRDKHKKELKDLEK